MLEPPDDRGTTVQTTLRSAVTFQGVGHEAPAPRRQQPPMQAHQPAPVVDEDEQQDQDRIEIPAFLRRQAN